MQLKNKPQQCWGFVHEYQYLSIFHLQLFMWSVIPTQDCLASAEGLERKRTGEAIQLSKSQEIYLAQYVIPTQGGIP